MFDYDKKNLKISTWLPELRLHLSISVYRCWSDNSHCWSHCWLIRQIVNCCKSFHIILPVTALQNTTLHSTTWNVLCRITKFWECVSHRDKEEKQTHKFKVLCRRQTSVAPVLFIKTNKQTRCFQNTVASWEPLAALLPLTQHSLASLSPAWTFTTGGVIRLIMKARHSTPPPSSL